MKIGWATPFNTRSAIGRFSRYVGEELHARGHEVTILRLESGPELALEPLESAFRTLSAAEAEVGDFDALVVNVGNHAPYHAQLLPLLARRPALAIFHDAEMRDFHWGMQHRHRLDLDILEGWGTATAAAIDDLVDPEARPILATLAGMAWGAVVHGPHYRATVEAFCPGPVAELSLCFPDTREEAEPAAPATGRRVLIFGVINANKQPSRVMRAIAALRKKVGPIELHLAGAVEDRVRGDLLEQARRLRIAPPVFHGYVSDARLTALIDDSHIVCCLRYPVSEGGSASLVTALYHGRPMIVSDVASYSVVPDNLVAKVSYGDNERDLADAMAAIFADPAGADARAARARTWARRRYSAETYVDGLLPLLTGHRGTERMVRLAREIAPSLLAPDGETMTLALPEMVRALDWMHEAQGPQGTR